MYTILHETDEATTVNLSVYGQFLAGGGRQLVTVGGRTLKIFRLNPYALIPGDTPQSWTVNTRLECMYSVKLFAPVHSMAVARLSAHSSTVDCLLLAFEEAKLSFVYMDEAEHAMRTISLHSFEDEMLKDGFTRDQMSPEVRVDPSNRCAAMLIFGRHLAVVPLNTEGQLASYTVALSELDSRLENVLDIAFLDGYYEPTLLFLYEPMQTTAGRASIRHDTVLILGVSLNIVDRVQAVVWQLSHLPMDCSRLLAMPIPVGGALLIGADEIIYLNQSVPPCGLAMNSCLDGFTSFPLKDTVKSLAVSLDGSAFGIVTPARVAIGAKDGRLFMLELELDSTTGVVKGLRMEHAYDSSIPHTMTSCSGRYLFVGSRLGDSQLLQYWLEGGSTMNNDELPSKRLKTDDNAAMTNHMDEEDFDELYGQYLKPAATVTSSGHGKDGAICILQRSIRPDIKNSIPALGGSNTERVWTIGRREDDSQRWMLVARPMQTLVLELGTEMVETDRAGFAFGRTTIAAGDLADGSIAVQVTPMSIVLVDMTGGRLVQMDLDLNFPLVAASIVDPMVAVLTENGRLMLFELGNDLQLRTVPISTGFSGLAPITAICLYRDMSGLFNFCTGEGVHRHSRLSRSDSQTGGPAAVSSLNTSMDTTAMSTGDGLEKKTMDDEEDFFLYGESKAQSTKVPIDHRVVNQSTTSTGGRKRAITDLHGAMKSEETGDLETDVLNPNSIMPSLWLVVARESGQLQILALPDLLVVWSAKKAGHLVELMTDSPEDEANLEPVKLDEMVAELLLYGMGFNQARPILMVVADQQMAMYELFAFDESSISGRLAIRFRRLPTGVVARTERYTTKDGKLRGTMTAAAAATGDMVSGTAGVRTNTSILHAFDRVGNYMNGVFVSGPYPSFVIFGRGLPRVHPMTIDGPARAFAAFNNISCPFGYLYISEREQTMRIAALPSELDLDFSCPVQKIPFKKIVNFVVYQLQSNTYAVVSSVREQCKNLTVMVGEERTAETHDKGKEFIYPTIDQFALHLYSPDDWKAPIANTEMKFEEFEVVTALAEVLLKSESTVSGLQEYLAVGTACNYGEEILVRGRIILGQIIEVVPEPGQPTSRHRIKTLYDKDQKGPITAICACRGYLLTAMAQKIFIWLFRDGDLQGISFLDMHFYVHQMVGLRNLALAADLYHSVSLIRYQEECKALSLASRDARCSSGLAPPMGIEFIVDGRQLGMVSSDEAGTITIFAYQPETKEALGGQRLLPKSQVNAGAKINAFVRVRCHVTDALIEQPAVMRHRQLCMFATLDGSMGTIIPLGEKVFRRLHMLQQVMSSQLAHPAGLNPRASRSARCAVPSTTGAQTGQRAMVDGDLVFQYLYLSQLDKLDLAKRLGTSRHQLVDDLVELDRLCTHF